MKKIFRLQPTLAATFVFLLIQFIFVNHVHAQLCTAALVNKVGDQITVVATLTTTDPNEDGEGEPLYVTSSGGELADFDPNYAIHRFNTRQQKPTKLSPAPLWGMIAMSHAF